MAWSVLLTRLMRQLVCLMHAVALVMLAGMPVVAAAPQGDARSAALRQFDGNVKQYVKLRRDVEGKVGALPKTAEPAAITQRQHALGEAIREARPDARPGDLFSTPVAALIRRVIARDLAQRRPVDRRAFVVEQPSVGVRVNDFYPTSVPLASVPPRLLARLPRLPDGLEYRFVGSTLILRDVDPNLVVDVLPNAIPARYRKR